MYNPVEHQKMFKRLSRETGRIHRAALRPAETRGSAKRHDVRYKVDNALRGSYGETDLDTKTITVNKKAHKKDGESMIDTMVHEHMHLAHPKMREKTVRKLTQGRVERMGKKAKARLYAKFN